MWKRSNRQLSRVRRGLRFSRVTATKFQALQPLELLIHPVRQQAQPLKTSPYHALVIKSSTSQQNPVNVNQPSITTKKQKNAFPVKQMKPGILKVAVASVSMELLRTQKVNATSAVRTQSEADLYALVRLGTMHQTLGSMS